MIFSISTGFEAIATKPEKVVSSFLTIQPKSHAAQLEAVERAQLSAEQSEAIDALIAVGLSFLPKTWWKRLSERTAQAILLKHSEPLVAPGQTSTAMFEIKRQAVSWRKIRSC